MPERLDLSFITLNYKNVDLTRRCICAIAESMSVLPYSWEVIVVDNSAKESGDTLRQAVGCFPVVIIPSEVNLGFAKANNTGVASARGETLVILNNDAFVNMEVINTGLKALKADPELAIWAPSLRSMDGEIQSSAGGFPRLRHLIAEYTGLVQEPSVSLPMDRPTRVGSVIGAFMMIPSGVYRRLGGFDEDYFFTCEDIDLCKRVAHEKLGILYDPLYSVVHIGGASQGWNWIMDPHLHNCRVKYFFKNHGAIAGLAAWLIIRPSLVARRFLRILKKRAA